jgi:hypothetical protein
MTKSTAERLMSPDYVEPDYTTEIISESRDLATVPVRTEGKNGEKKKIFFLSVLTCAKMKVRFVFF